MINISRDSAARTLPFLFREAVVYLQRGQSHQRPWIRPLSYVKFGRKKMILPLPA